jgi:predicted ATPase/DNA-binding winged helix-turn-helix (wHTH) protein
MDDSRDVTFGPFRLQAAERLLTKTGAPVPLGSRALDILMLLVERAGEVVSKNDLMARVWPSMTVDASVLRVHVAILRKALGDRRGAVRYVTNVSGRGYCFVAPVTRPATRPVEPESISAHDSSRADPAAGLPHRVTPVMGRDDAVRAVCQQLAAHRLVTLHGPGGIGKTTVAVAVGRSLLATFDGAVRFVDLGSIGDPVLVPGTVAAALGLAVQASDPAPGLIDFLSDRRMLLILDCCEHVIDAVAILAEQIVRQAPHVSVLATSRESLRAEGEYLQRLAALDAPPAGAALTACELRAFPATRLFVERAAAGGYRLEDSDAEATLVAEICRRLDGNALAIELAAGRAGAFGLQDIAAFLDSRLTLLWQGRRTAAPRHQTLQATLDWSHNLIPDVERAVLRRLSVFAGVFTLPAAQVIAADDSVEETQVAEALAQLVAKSLVQAYADGTLRRYRLLDTMRAYARVKLADSGDAQATARRHASYYRSILERGAAGGDPTARTAVLGDVRAAQEWCFADGGAPALGVQLVAGAAPLLLELALLGECRRWTERALALLDPPARGTRCEMELQAALGQSLMVTSGNGDRVQAALERALEIAVALDDRRNEFKLLGRLHLYHRRTGEFSRLLPISLRAERIAQEVADPVAATAAHVLLGVAHHLVGNQAEAGPHLEASSPELTGLRPVNSSHFGFHRGPLIGLARVLWLRGYPDRAVEAANRLITESAAYPDVVTFCIALIWGVSVFQWTGDWETVEESSERLIDHAARHALEPYRAVGLGLKGEVLVNRGEAARGIDLLQSAVASLRAERYELYIPGFSCTLAEGLAMTGRLDKAIATIDDTIRYVDAKGPAFNRPELLRIKGELLAQATEEAAAEDHFRQSIALADRQSALSWRLRAATSLTRLRLRHGSAGEARRILVETYDRFGEGFATADLAAARRLLDPTGAAGGTATKPFCTSSQM